MTTSNRAGIHAVVLGGAPLPFADRYAKAAARFCNVTSVRLTRSPVGRPLGGGLFDPGRPDGVLELGNAPVIHMRPTRVFRILGGRSQASRLVEAIGRISELNGKVDVIHSHFYGSAVGLPEACEKLNLPLVHTEHSSAFTNLQQGRSRTLSRGGRWQADRLFRSATMLTAVSRYLADEIRARGFEYDFEVLPNPVDESQFSFSSRMPSTQRRVVSVGRLWPDKGFEFLLKAVAVSASEVNVAIIGDGPERHRLESLRDRLGLRERVRFLGRLEPREVASHLRNSDVFFLCSVVETFGVAFVEAMMCGLPVVGPAIGGIPEIAGSEGAYLYSPGDAEGAARSLDDALNERDEARNRRISRRAMAAFSYEAVGEQIARAYERCVSVGRQGAP